CDAAAPPKGTVAQPLLAGDPFPDVVGRPPEVDPSGLTAETLGGGILHHGCLLVRGLLEPARVDALVDTVDRAFDAREHFLAGAPAEETSPWYAPCARWDAV